MKLLVLCCGLLSALIAGCVTKGEAKAQAQAAYLQGQQQGLIRAEQMRQPSVTVLGAVRTPVVAWTEELTLAKAIAAAGYYNRSDPREIVIVRSGQAIPFDPKRLLAGDDMPLQSGDVVQLR